MKPRYLAKVDYIQSASGDLAPSVLESDDAQAVMSWLEQKRNVQMIAVADRQRKRDQWFRMASLHKPALSRFLSEAG